jgi:[protein-PII] uridylyltransferase
VEKSLRGEVRLREIIQDKRKRETRARSFPVEPEADIDNTLSSLYTVLQIAGLDRLGLLYEVTTLLSKQNLNIGSAHIVTFGEKAVDAFYVTDLTGAKITAPARQAALKRHLMSVLQSD